MSIQFTVYNAVQNNRHVCIINKRLHYMHIYIKRRFSRTLKKLKVYSHAIFVTMAMTFRGTFRNVPPCDWLCHYHKFCTMIIPCFLLFYSHICTLNYILTYSSRHSTHGTVSLRISCLESIINDFLVPL